MTNMAVIAEAKMGGNFPPADLLLGEALRERLTDDHGDLLKRRDDLLAAAARLPEINSEHIAGRITDFIRQVAAAIKAANGKRVAEKEPYLDGGRTIDGFFSAGIADPLDAVKKTTERALTLWQREVAAQERREREERERLAREEENARREAARLAEQQANDEATLADAIAAEQRRKDAQADRVKAEQATNAKAADMSRTRGEYGALASLRTTWEFEGLDRAALDLEALREHLPADGLERAVRSFVRAGGRELRGVRIFEHTHSVVR